MVNYQYSLGSNVCFNSNCYSVILLREVSNNPAYLLRNIENGQLEDNVLESNCMNCTPEHIINTCWPSFVYTGDNNAASNWIFNNLIKKISSASNIQYGPNSDNTVYTFSINNGANSWTKNKA